MYTLPIIMAFKSVGRVCTKLALVVFNIRNLGK